MASAEAAPALPVPEGAGGAALAVSFDKVLCLYIYFWNVICVNGLPFVEQILNNGKQINNIAA